MYFSWSDTERLSYFSFRFVSLHLFSFRFFFFCFVSFLTVLFSFFSVSFFCGFFVTFLTVFFSFLFVFFSFFFYVSQFTGTRFPHTTRYHIFAPNNLDVYVSAILPINFFFFSEYFEQKSVYRREY